MREILFRGKAKDDGKWVHGYIYKIWEKAFILWGMVNEVPDMIEIDPKTICEYSGLTDKEGKKIFEGDIVEYQRDNDDCPFPDKDTKKRIGRVFFQDWRASFALAEGRDGSAMCNRDLFEYVRNGNRTEVIGNIFDNPKLIASKKGVNE